MTAKTNFMKAACKSLNNTIKNIISRTTLMMLAAGILSLGSCKKVLDQQPDGKISVADIFTDSLQTQAFLKTCYSKIPTFGKDYWYDSRGPVVVSDEAWDADDIDYPTGMGPRMYNGDAYAANNPMTDMVGFLNVSNGLYWERYFTSIRNCSVFIAGIDAYPFREVTKKRWKAEAHLLRAFYYSELLRWYGTGLPIIRQALTLDADFAKVKRSSYYEVVKFIMEDCDAALAVENLVLPYRINADGESSRFSKAVAEAIKSRAILYAASPLYNEGKDIWEEAYQVNKKALENLRSNGYELYNKVSFASLYKGPNSNLPNATANYPAADLDKYQTAAARINEYFTQNLDYMTNRDTETIYNHWADSGPVFHTEGIGAQGGYKAGACPSQELVDAYETVDGQPVLDLSNPYLDEKHLQPNYNPNNTKYDPNNPYANRDPRFYASIYYNGSQKYCWWATSLTPDCLDNYGKVGNNNVGFANRTVSTWVGEPLMGIATTGRTKTRTGYYIRKFMSPNEGDHLAVGGPKDKVFRLGEVILNYAEAAAESGHLAEATAAVNEIRERAGMPDIPSGLSKADLILRVRHERRIELALEGRRYFDVRRWQKPDGDLAKTDKWITAMEITRNTKPDGSFSHYTYKRKPVRLNERLCYTNKFLKASIPQAEVNKIIGINGENWQNPGW